ncbi:MAG: oligosaccharide flippase family protein [Clostridia bacterium]
MEKIGAKEGKKELSIKANMIWNSIGNFVYLFSQWITTYLVTMLLGFEDAGVFALAMSLGNTFFTISAYGMRNYQTSDTKAEHSDNAYLYSRLVTSIFTIVLCVIYCFIGAFTTFQRLCIITFVLFKIGEALVDIYHGICQRTMRMDIIGKSFLMRSLINTAAFIAGILITRNLFVAILLMTIVSFIFILTYDRINASKFFVHKKTNYEEIKTLLIKCFPLALFNILFTLFATIPRLFLEQELGSEMLGIYSSIALPAVIVQVFCTYIFSPFTTIFARLYNDHKVRDFVKLFLKIVFYLVIISIVAIIGALLLGDFGLQLLFTSKIAPYTYLFIPIIVITILTAFSWFISMVLTVARNFMALTVSAIVSTIVCALCSSVFVKTFGMNGASFAAIVSFVVQILILLVFLFISMKKFAKAKPEVKQIKEDND